MSARRTHPGSVLMEFIIVAPLMLILVSMILQFAQIWIAREITAYAAYCACRSVLSAGSRDDAELGAQRAAELACSWMCLAGMPQGIRETELGSSKTVVLPKFHDRNLTASTEEFDESKHEEVTVYFDDGPPVEGEIIIPGWGGIPGSDSSGSNERIRHDLWEHGDRRVTTMIIRAPGYTPNQTAHDGFTWLEEDKNVRYALVRVKFKFPLLLPLAGRMISWFVSPNASSSGGADDLGRAGTVDYGSHELTGGNRPAWQGQETVMDENGNMVDRSSVAWGFDEKFPAIELTEFCMLPMPYSVDKGFGDGETGFYSKRLPKEGEDS